VERLVGERLTVGGSVQRALDLAGVRGVYGAPLPGVRVTPVGSARVAHLMADADRRLRGGRAAVHEGEGRLAVGRVGPPPYVVDRVAKLVDLPRVLAAGALVHVQLDPRDHVPEGRVPQPPPAGDLWTPPADELVERLRAAERPLLVAGPGVVHADAIAGVHALATAANLGVLNSWGAKGIYDWRSRHHLATVGLQERDAELAGVADADLVAVVGPDHRELTGPGWRTDVEIEPGALAPLAERWSRPREDVPFPPLRAGLAEVTQAGWLQDQAPLAPTRVTKHYGELVAAGGVVAADPGTAGYWVARTVGTTRPRAVHVPAEADTAGFAVAAVTVARLLDPGRTALAVVDGATTDAVQEALDVAARLGIPVPVEAWTAAGRPLDADAHHDRLWSLATTPTSTTTTLATDPTQLTAMITAAGPLTAWRP
jgi:thiamine pyrophosphate-dependent enzyme